LLRTAHTDARSERPGWPELSKPLGGTAGALATFAVAYALLVAAGLLLKERSGELTILWPAAGLLMFALWFAPLPLWPAIIAMQCALELLLSAVIPGGFPQAWGLLLTLGNTVAAVVGAWLARRWFSQPRRVHLRRVLQFIGASAVGALAGALIGAFGALQLVPGAQYLNQLQVWWAGSWLGALTIVPIAYSWAVPLRRMYQTLKLESPLELLLFAVLVLGATAGVFLTPPGQAASILQVPVILAAVLAAAAFRLPPRWSTLLAAVAIFLAAAATVRGDGPYTNGSEFQRLLQLQTFLAALMLLTALLGTAIADLRIALRQLSESEERYRNFVENSGEAVWRVELTHPMSVELPIEAQLEWLQRYGYIAECNIAYNQIDGSDGRQPPLPWRREVPWHAIYMQHLEQAVRQRYSMDGLRFTATIEGRQHTFLTSFTGVVDGGYLRRIWGVARDITELAELNSRLQREQERLKAYARQLVSADEKARRAAAVDLHDGIGQSLVTMNMTLEAARVQSQPPVRSLLDDVRALLRDVQERTRSMIADLSPPGLYDLGLEPALQWLAVYVRQHDHLQVELDARLREEAIPIEMRVLVFKLVRELLRNVAKHAGVSVARVQVRGDRERVSVEVRDEGKGFDWQPDFFAARARGFGLWSIADRVREAGGEFSVDTAPGRGSRVLFSVPLRRDQVGRAEALRQPAGGGS
jgi:signal transduction histidine kinase